MISISCWQHSNNARFLKLQRIRARDKSMLNVLNKSDGHSGEDGDMIDGIDGRRRV